MLGAGRGPFIRCAVNATVNTGRKLNIVVVEKNPNAIVTLSALIKVMWPNENIELISKDIRLLKLKEKADILVSEMLGSFGDNELSPECLDGAQKHLKPTGVSIPCNSISYIQPITASRVYNQMRDKSFDLRSVYVQSKSRCEDELQTAWLCYLNSVYYIDKPKPLFTFVHPNLDDPIDNSRHGILTFKPKLDCVLHGFVGYFTSKLYEGIEEISIHPLTHNQG